MRRGDSLLVLPRRIPLCSLSALFLLLRNANLPGGANLWRALSQPDGSD